jgi:hypothetical protein
LIVLPADNVELTPDAGALQGLAGDTVPAHVTLPARQQPPLVYRDLGGSEPAKFVATARQQARRTLVNSTAALRAGRGSVEVVQKLRYQVQFEGATAFEWWVPDRLAENSAFQVLDEAQQPLECKASADDAPTRDGFRRLRWEAPQPVLGVKEFTVRSLLEIPLATGVLRPTVTAAFLLPIVDPAPSEGVQLTVTQADDVQVEPASSTASLRWERVGGQEFRGALAADVGALDLRVTPLERPRLRGTAVQRMMIQTWLTRHDRQDRVAIRLIAPDSKVRVRLPQGAGISDLIAALDGERWEALRVTDQDEVVVALPESKQGRECVLELWYAFADGRSVHNAIWTRLDPPVIVGATTVRQVMWQVDSPADEHLLCDPSTYVPEMHWLWRGAFFGRESSQTQEQLERWVGASVQQPLPAAENHYLFSSFGRNPILQLALVRRRWLLLVASGAVLLVGTLLIYFPVLRHPAGFLLLGVALVTGALLAPEMAAVAGQGAVLGTVACAITALLRRVWSPPIPAPPIMDRSRRARPDSVVERPSTPGSRSGITTTAAPAYVGPESHP